MLPLTAVLYYLSLKKDQLCVLYLLFTVQGDYRMQKEDDVMFPCFSPFALMNWTLLSEIYLRVECCQGKSSYLRLSLR